MFQHTRTPLLTNMADTPDMTRRLFSAWLGMQIQKRAALKKTKQKKKTHTMSLSNIWHHFWVPRNIASSINTHGVEWGNLSFNVKCLPTVPTIRFKWAGGAWQLYGHIGRHLTFLTVDRINVWQAESDNSYIENKKEWMRVCVSKHPVCFFCLCLWECSAQQWLACPLRLIDLKI